MKSQPSAVLDRSGIASRSVEKIPHDVETLRRPNNVKLEAFIVKLAWALTSAVLLFVVIGLVLVLAGYAGSIFAPDAPKAPAASWPRK